MKENVDAHERIARFHILATYELGGWMSRSDGGGAWVKQEIEQLNKSAFRYDPSDTGGF